MHKHLARTARARRDHHPTAVAMPRQGARRRDQQRRKREQLEAQEATQEVAPQHGAGAEATPQDDASEAANADAR